MLSIFAPTEIHEDIQSIIHEEDRLHELVDIHDILGQKPTASSYTLIIRKDAIYPVLDWFNYSPPFLLAEEIAFNKSNLLGLLFARLGNFPKMESYLQESNPTLL